MSTATVIYLYSSALMLVVVEKVIYEATSIKQSYSECKTVFSAIFTESE